MSEQKKSELVGVRMTAELLERVDAARLRRSPSEAISRGGQLVDSFLLCEWAIDQGIVTWDPDLMPRLQASIKLRPLTPLTNTAPGLQRALPGQLAQPRRKGIS